MRDVADIYESIEHVRSLTKDCRQGQGMRFDLKKTQ